MTAEVRRDTPAVSWWSKLFAPMRRPQLAFGAAMAMLLLLGCGAGWLYLERTRLTEQLVRLQDEAQAERSSRRQREQELARRAQEAEKENAGRQQDNEQLQAELEQFRRLRRQPGPPALLSFLLTPAPIRGQNSPPPQIPLVKSPVRLLMELQWQSLPELPISPPDR